MKRMMPMKVVASPKKTAMKASAMKPMKAMKKKPNVPTVDWRDWEDAPKKKPQNDEGEDIDGEANSQKTVVSVHGSSEALGSEDAAKPPLRVTGKKGVAPAVDSTGQPLPEDNHEPYTKEQAFVMKKLCEQDAATKSEFDKNKSREQRRCFVNSMIPRDATYGLRIDPKLAAGHIKRKVVLTDHSNEQDEWVGTTLTDLEVAWGSAEKVALGLKRGDVRIAENGMHERRTCRKVVGRGRTDALQINQAADCSGQEAEKMMDDSLKDVLEDWKPVAAQATRSARAESVRSSKKRGSESVGAQSAGCSDVGWMKLKKAYEVVSKCLRETKAAAMQLRAVMRMIDDDKHRS